MGFSDSQYAMIGNFVGALYAYRLDDSEFENNLQTLVRQFEKETRLAMTQDLRASKERARRYGNDALAAGVGKGALADAAGIDFDSLNSLFAGE